MGHVRTPPGPERSMAMVGGLDRRLSSLERNLDHSHDPQATMIVAGGTTQNLAVTGGTRDLTTNPYCCYDPAIWTEAGLTQARAKVDLYISYKDPGANDANIVVQSNHVFVDTRSLCTLGFYPSVGLTHLDSGWFAVPANHYSMTNIAALNYTFNAAGGSYTVGYLFMSIMGR